MTIKKHTPGNLPVFMVIALLLQVLLISAQQKKTLLIADRLKPLETTSQLQIREKKKDAWVAIGDTIAGLNYQEGYAYKVKVLVNNGHYQLVRLLSKKKTGYNPAQRMEAKQKWVLISMHDNGYVIPNRDTTIFISIDLANNRISGHSYCNSFKGGLKTEGNSVSISEIAYTKMKCAEEQKNTMDNVVKNLLEASDNFHFEGDILVFSSQKGSRIVFQGW